MDDYSGFGRVESAAAVSDVARWWLRCGNAPVSVWKGPPRLFKL